MAGCWRDRHASWLRWPECAGADGAQRATVLRTCLRFSRTPRRHREAFVVGRRWAMSICQAFGARTIHLAAGYGRNCLSVACAAFDVTRRHRLAPSAEDLDAGDRGLSNKCDSPLFMRVLQLFSTYFHGILC